MLDDLKMIHERDAQDALGIAEKQGEQLSKSFNVASFDASGVANIVYAGMGGSALAASISQVWPGYPMPFEIVRQYDIPEYVSEKTLFIAASYSGNTEETLSAVEQAEARGAKIVVIAGGGKLAEIAQQKGYPLAVLPKAAQPRYAVLYNLKALLDILAACGIINIDELRPELESAAEFLQSSVGPWRPDVATTKNPAKQLAQEIMGKSLVVYAGPKLAPIAYKWKISCNENAKHVAWTGQYPEFNHNEFIGWSKQPTEKPYTIVELHSEFEHERVKKRFEVSSRLLSGMRPSPHVVDAQGETLLQQLVWTMAFGDFVTLYLALLNGLNPAPVDLVETFKQELTK
jgi:glucose/mannose-6-phosphate isomerase